MLGFAVLDAHAQADPAATSKRFSVVPGVSVSEVLTDNARLTDSDRKGDLITEVSPSLRMRGNTAKLQGSLDYSVMGLDYARGTDSNSVQQSLAADLKAQGLDNHVFVDANANISRQNVSALGTQTSDPALRTSNQTEVKTFAVDPYVQGRLGSLANYQLGVNYSRTNTDSDSIGDSQNVGESFHLGPDTSQARVGWAIDASRQRTDFSLGRNTTTESAVGSLIFTPSVELQLSLRGGREANNVQTLDIKDSTTYGGGLRWTPSTRTTLSLQDDKRFFGNSYAFDFEHRTARTVWSLSYTRSQNSDASAAAQGQPMSAFDLLYLQLTSRYPDPIARANQTLIELQKLGLNPLAVVPPGFLTNAVTLEKNLSLSFGYLGLRTSFLAAAQQSQTSRLDPLSTAADSLSAGDAIRQRSVSLSVSHQLTPQSSASLNLGVSRTLDLLTGSRLDLRSISANWTTRLGPRTQASLGARHSVATGEAPYVESALLGSLTLQF